MAIQPVFAQAILARTKLVELRKRTLAADIRTVLLYETSPTQAIVGAFDICSIEMAEPRKIWREYSSETGIRKQQFDAYFRGNPIAVAIRVASVERYLRPIPLDLLDPVPSVPQSVNYLSASILRTVRSIAESELSRQTDCALV